MAATLQPRLVRVVKPLLQVKKVKHFHRRTLSTISAFNYHHSSGPWANPFIHSSPFRYNPREFLQPAKFHASASRAILPAGPQVIEGTANDPAPVPPPSPTHGSYHWTFERLASAALIPLTIAPFAAGSLNPITDAVLCATILIHSHIGFQSIIIDYIPSKRLPRTRTLFWWGLRAATLLVAVGFYEFETNDVGLTEAIKRIWTA